MPFVINSSGTSSLSLLPAAGTDEPESGEGEEVLGDLETKINIALFIRRAGRLGFEPR